MWDEMGKRLDSAVAVRNATTPGRHPVGETLYLMVWPSGRKSWVQRLTIDGKRKDLGLGPYPALSLAQARERAHGNLSQVKSGGNPLAEKQEEAALAAMPTFEALAQQHVAENLGSWRNAKHGAQWRSTLETYAFPILGDMKVNEITRRHVVDVLSPIWTSKPETARRVRQRIRAVLDRAAALEFIDYNPAGDAINAALAKQPRIKNHHRALPYGKLPTALRAVRESPSHRSVKLAFELLALTACRSGEVRGMTWDEVDLGEATWTIPAARMKAGRPHRVPLSQRALVILQEVRGLSDGVGIVFPTPQSGAGLSDMAFTQLLRRLELDFVPHGLRSSFRDWAAEQADARHDVVERALAHEVSNATEAAYFRSELFELRRKLMEEWGEFLESGASR
jgi:integrase